MNAKQLDDFRYWTKAAMFWIEMIENAEGEAITQAQRQKSEECLIRAIDMLTLNRKRVSCGETFASKLVSMIA
jgi:hypothetical protein